MYKHLKYIISIPYFCFAIVIIYSRIFKAPELENILRPALMLLLGCWYILGCRKREIRVNWIFMIGLILALLGDIYRMPLVNNFIAGLFFFLFAQLAYSGFFLWESRGRILKLIGQGWLYLVVIFLILLSLLIGLLPTVMQHGTYAQLIALPSLMLVLFLLVLSTYVYSQVYYDIYGKYVMLAGLVFLFSGSILALNRFSIDVKMSSAWVITSYTVAQWLLVYGYMNSKRKA
jgi:uncharacterized membrane protein YhhN